MQSRISKVPVDTMAGAMCITKAQKIQTIYSKKTNKRNMHLKWKGNDIMKNKYNVGDKVRAKIHYQNDKRTEVDAVIIGIELENDNVDYKIKFDATPIEKEQGCTGCEGYVNEIDIIKRN